MRHFMQAAKKGKNQGVGKVTRILAVSLVCTDPQLTMAIFDKTPTILANV
jgi:hypothetical protein